MTDDPRFYKPPKLNDFEKAQQTDELYRIREWVESQFEALNESLDRIDAQLARLKGMRH